VNKYLGSSELYYPVFLQSPKTSWYHGICKWQNNPAQSGHQMRERIDVVKKIQESTQSLCPKYQAKRENE
jgi:hypothetical protein